MAFKSQFRQNLSYESPEALLLDLRNRKVEGLLSHQTDIIRRYMIEGFKEKDVAFELPTGSGKTLVGLLIGEFRRRRNEKVVYLCPTRQLANQVVEQAVNKYGIRAAAFVGPVREYDQINKAEYNNSEIIAVTTYTGLFNASPFFYNPDLIILDDAHSAENYISSFWSLSISRFDHSSVYRAVIDTLNSVMPSYYYKRLISNSPISSESYQWVEKLPTPKLFEKADELIDLLDTITEDTPLKYSWSRLRDNLCACHLYLSWNSILIRPVIPPSKTFAPFANADQRIYMSATLGAGGDLERITGVSPIKRLPIPDGWDRQGIGRRFFFFPEMRFPHDEALDLAIDLCNKTPRGLVLVPDDKSVDILSGIVRDKGFKIFYADGLEHSKKEFTEAENAIALLANRLDGIDLSGEDCRYLIVKDLPRATNLQERFIQTRMAASVLLNDRIRTRVIQAIGRCTRSATDYSAICVLGQELMDLLIQRENREYFHPELQGELTFGYEESKLATSTVEFMDNFKIFLEHGEEWDIADSQIMSLRNSAKKKVDNAAEKLFKSAQSEVQYMYALWQQDYERAVQLVDTILKELQGDDVRGYRGFWYYLAGSAAWLAAEKEGLKEYIEVYKDKYKRAASCTGAVTWLRSLYKQEITEESGSVDEYISYVIERLENVLSSIGTSTNKFEREVEYIKTNLQRPEAHLFEEAHKRLGLLLGYDSGNSDDNAAPDPWWKVCDTLCFVAEDKTDGDNNTPVSVSKTRQAVSHPNWIRHNLDISDEATIIPIMITTATTIDPDAVPHTGEVVYWHIDDFRSWAEEAISVVRRLRSSFVGPGNIFWRENAIKVYREFKMDPLNLMKKLKTTPLSSLPRS